MEVRLAHEEKFRTVERRLDEGEARMDEHDRQISKMLSISAAFDERFKSLIIEIERTNNNLEKQAVYLEKQSEQNTWFKRVIIGALVSFFFYAIQTGLFFK